MASTVAPGCPVHSEFDPLSPRYLKDPFAVMRELPARAAPVFYAPAIDYYVVTRPEDIEAIFLDHETFSAAAAQLPLAALSKEAGELLLGGGHRPAPPMVSLDPPEHTRVRRHTARAAGAVGLRGARRRCVARASRGGELGAIRGPPEGAERRRTTYGEAGTTAARAAGGADAGVRHSTAPVDASSTTTPPSCA
ncbi:MAG TPA: hypothetical protein VF087_07860 [Solirubrobacteraceae bacterium]